MKNSFSFLIVFLTFCCFFYACKKDRTTVYVNNTPVVIPVIPTVSQFVTLSSFYKTMRPSVQSFGVDMATGGTVRGDRGYTLQFTPNAFMDMSGKPVTGTVKIELTEVTNYAEMVGTGALTEANNGVLASAGMFNVRATKNGQEVYLTTSIKASIPVNKDADISNIKLFNGNPTVTNTKDTSVKWFTDSIPFKFNADSMKQVYDSLKKIWEEKRIIKFDLNFCGWCNLDAYYNSSTGNKIKCKFTGISNILNAEVFMKLNQGNLKGLYRLTYDQTQDEFTSTYYNLPPDWNIHLIVLVKDKDKKVYVEDRTFVNSGTLQTFSNLKEISDADLETFFKGLK